jgi:hypothetical protein
VFEFRASTLYALSQSDVSCMLLVLNVQYGTAIDLEGCKDKVRIMLVIGWCGER